MKRTIVAGVCAAVLSFGSIAPCIRRSASARTR